MSARMLALLRGSRFGDNDKDQKFKFKVYQMETLHNVSQAKDMKVLAAPLPQATSKN